MTTPSTPSTFINAVTFRDVIEHLSDYMFGNGQDAENRILKRAVRAAFRELMDSHKWRYALAEFPIYVVEPYETGTVAFDYTGGANELQLTLTDGTWPSWAASGRVKIGSNIYPVNLRVSDSIVTLDATINPGEDVASTSDWIIYRNVYQLPDDFQRIDDIIDNGTGLNHFYVDPSDWLRYERYQPGLGEPFAWTITNDPKRSGAFAVRTVGYPTTDKELMFLYQRHFTDPVFSGYEIKCTVGTVAVTSGSATITGTSTTFDAGMVDSILRISTDGTTEPTGNDGLNPFTQEFKIKSYTSATVLTAYSNATANASGKKYVVSSHIELAHHMLNALLRCAERQLCLISKDQKKQATANDEWMRALRLALENDDKLLIMRHSGQAAWRGGLSLPDPSETVQSS